MKILLVVLIFLGLCFAYYLGRQHGITACVDYCIEVYLEHYEIFHPSYILLPVDDAV